MFFNFKFYGDINFGSGARKKLPEILNKNNYNNVVLVIDHNLLKIPSIKELIHLLRKNTVKIVACKISEPTYEFLQKNRIDSKKLHVDAFIGIGGGSSLDMAKGISVLYTNKDHALNYRGFDKFTNPILPIIALPTTAGTGSEITPNASFIDTKEKRKMGINGESLRPEIAILDPELTLSCPMQPTISAGVDSLVHATEAFVAKKSNTLAKIFAREGFSRVFENLPLLVNDLDNIKLREEVMYGAFLSAIALMNSGTGPAAAMSYPLGVHFGVPHGIGGGIFLPHVIQHNIDAGFYDYSKLYEAGGITNSNQKSAKVFIKRVWEVWRKLNVPSDLRKLGMSSEQHITSFVADTMDLKQALDQNPVPFYKNEINQILSKLLNNK